MRIGFDAKRVFYNRSGLGNYSRDIVQALYQKFPEEEYILYTPSVRGSISFLPSNRVGIATPPLGFGKLRSSYWRTMLLAKRLERDEVDIYHGLSHEVPYNIQKTRVKSVVTIHDLIFMRYPQWYGFIDRKIYERKVRYSCNAANKIIAVSQQTKDDLISFMGIDEQKIQVIYQGCNDIFKKEASQEDLNRVHKKHGLPDRYILSLGTIEERKNLLTVIRALHEGNIDIPLVAIGRSTKYMVKIRKYMMHHGIKNIHFLHSLPSEDLPVIYQGASMFVYPSVFEGFGIPILEALNSKIPVITSKGGCFSEVGGAHSIYVDPLNVPEMTDAIQKVLGDTDLRKKMIEEGFRHAQKFDKEGIAGQMMKIYKELYNAG